MNYFYIIQRNKQIFEIEYTKERFEAAFEQWQKGGLLIFPSLGAGINSADISNILNEEMYGDYIFSASPKKYIRGGIWYDQEGGIIGYSNKKQEQLNSIKKLSENKKEVIVSEEENKRVNEMIRNMVNKFKLEKEKRPLVEIKNIEKVKEVKPVKVQMTDKEYLQFKMDEAKSWNGHYKKLYDELS